MRAHASLRLGSLRGTTPELLVSPWYCAWDFCVVWEAGRPHKTSSPPTQRRNGRAFSSLTARGGGLPVGVSPALRDSVPSASRRVAPRWEAADRPPVHGLQKLSSPDRGRSAVLYSGLPQN